MGSGKSSLLNAVLAEMNRLQGEVSVHGLSQGFALATQESWIQNATVRDNILFGKPFNRKKYERTLEACELERDLTILSAGDMTEIGEKVSLAGIASFGVRERVSDTARPHLQ